MNLDDIRPTPGKTRVYLKSLQVYPKIPGRVPTNVCRARRHIAFSAASALLTARNACSSTRTVPCAAAMRAGGCGEAAGAACRWQCRRCGCDVFCFKIVAVLGMHFCDPNQLIATKQRNKLAAANKALCFLSHADRSKRTSTHRLHRHTFD